MIMIFTDVNKNKLINLLGYIYYESAINTC